MTIPNILTLVRIALVPVFLIFAETGDFIAALSVFVVAALTDTLDGKIARKYNLVTDFGKLFDPLADKLLVMSAVLVFVARGSIPAWAAAVILGREFAVTSLRMVAASKGIVIAASMSGKVKTFVQCIALCVMLFFWEGIVLFAGITLQDICVCVMVIVAAYSGIDYFVKNRRVLSGSLGKKEK